MTDLTLPDEDTAISAIATTPTTPAPVTPGNETPPFAKTRYTGAIMVCKQCQKRSSGPKKLKAKDLQQPLKRALGDARLRFRTVQTTCLGLCPKKAIAVAAVAAEGASLLAAIGEVDDLKPVAARLLGRTTD